MVVTLAVPPEIRRIVDRIVAGYEPERVILFGSWAEGRARDDSDVDLLVVKKTRDRPLDRVVQVRRAFRDPARSIGVDVLVLTPGEMERALQDGHSLVTRAVRRGVVLYAQ